MKISRHKMTFILNALMMTLMFVGYVLTTGLEVVTSDAVKFVVRGLVAVIAISIILHGRMIQTSIVLTIYLFLIFWVINQNEIAANLLFLIVIVSSINRLSEKDAAVVFLVSSAAAVLFHILLLSAGIVSTSAVQVGERERSALGFANANQFALVYLTLICSAFFVYKQVKTKWALLVLFGSLALSGWMMKIADSRTSMFSVVILLTVSFFGLFCRKVG